MQILNKFFRDQLSVWPMAAANFRSLKTVKTKELIINGLEAKLQYNPMRVASSTADVSAEAIAARKCFLCKDNQHKEQFHIPFEGRKGRMYRIQVNPFPIFKKHLVIVRNEHLPQAIWHHFPDMLDFASAYTDYTVFYNGPSSGASAPDHLHFQAVPRHQLPLENAIDVFLDQPTELLSSVKDATLYRYPGYVNGVFALKATTTKSLAKLFYRLLDCTDRLEGENEPMFNLYAYKKGEEYRSFIIMREAYRSHHYTSKGEDHLSISPGAADMAGFFIAPFKEDMDKVTASLLCEMLKEVTISDEEQRMIEFRLNRQQKAINVGLISATEISFEIISDGAGPQKVSWCDGRIAYNGMLYDELLFDSMTLSTQFSQASFVLHDLSSDLDQPHRELRYAGALKFVVEDDKILAINIIGEEDYLLSVISSEMKSNSSLDALKDHAINSRTWLEAKLEDKRDGIMIQHTIFDVCADEHCQPYEGLTMVITENARRAIDQTWGQVLHSDDSCAAKVDLI